MTVSEQVEAILGETISALSRLQTDELEDLEQRLTLIADQYGRRSTPSTRTLESKMDMLQACLNCMGHISKLVFPD